MFEEASPQITRIQVRFLGQRYNLDEDNEDALKKYQLLTKKARSDEPPPVSCDALVQGLVNTSTVCSFLLSH